MVTHGRDLDIVATIGAFNRGQEAHIHRRHPGSNQKVGTTWGGHRIPEGRMPCPRRGVAVHNRSLNVRDAVGALLEHNLGWVYKVQSM
jgi:hypothetical protein